MAEIAREPTRHPWLGRFVADPDKELADFLAGYARIAPYERAETPDAARMLFGPLPADDEARQALDKAVLQWLDARRREGVPPLQGPHLDRKLREIMDAIRLVSVLALPRTATDLRRRFVLWNSWIERLASLSGPDVRAELLSTLALTQRLVAQSPAGLNPFELVPLWLALCEQAGGQYPKSYLSIGLLGLRLLPERDKAPSQRPWMAGLACWAMQQQPDLDEFSRQWYALKALYPATKAHWRRAVAETLQQNAVSTAGAGRRQTVAEVLPAKLRDFWARDVDLLEQQSATKSHKDVRFALRPPAVSEVTSLRDRADQPISKIAPQIKRLISSMKRYAEETGDSYFLVTSACNLGMRLLEFQEDDPVGRGQLAVELARKALAWQPANVYAWALWRDGLEAQGDYDGAELIGWETIQRFPGDVQWPIQLAHFLAKLPGRQEEAELLLQEKIERFPTNAVLRNQLAELLIALDRTDDAIDVVDAAVAAQTVDEATFDVRARLAYRFEGIAAARRILEEGCNMFPGGPVLRVHLRMLDEGQDLPLVSRALRSVGRVTEPKKQEDETLQAVERRNYVRRLMDRLLFSRDFAEQKAESLEEVRRILTHDPNVSWVRHLETDLEGWSIGESPEVLSEFGGAFIDAMEWKDSGQLDALSAAHAGQGQMVDVARAFLLGDEDAAKRALIWLS